VRNQGAFPLKILSGTFIFYAENWIANMTIAQFALTNKTIPRIFHAKVYQ